MKAGWKAIRGRLGPIGLSLAAAAITAAGFAAFSIADDGEREDDGEERGDRLEMPAPPPPGVRMFHERLSDEDREKLEQFRQCMEDNGAPAPPRLDRGEGLPGPPSEEERDQIEDAFDACRDKLPEDIRHAGPPPFGCHAPGLDDDDEDGGREEDDGAENEQQGYVIPAPAPAPGATS